ncbi:MAG: tetratricopeptide repeat protein [Proteobacteria bacterium]|nr:tetratricopeptide repeat protein [Pseudomonadota bacterium]
MKIKGLLVDLKQSGLADTYEKQLSTAEVPFELLCASDVLIALGYITSETIAPLIIFSDDMSTGVSDLLRAYQTAFGPMNEFQAVVCSDPSPLYMAALFEFGVEQFIAAETWDVEVPALCRTIHEKLGNAESAECKTMLLAAAVRSGNTEQISEAKESMGDLASYDFRAAFAQGKASEASGNYDEALDSYRSAGGMNKMFRPTNTSLGEACLITGRVDEAIAIFEKLDRSNPNDVDRKSSLASAFVEKGDFESAHKYAAQAEALSPGSSRVAEIKAQVLLGQGKLGDAIGLLDQMSNVGPFFAAKLNDLGIKLSQAGKGKSALALYQKAHKVVRDDLKYKISLNAALASRRLQEFDLALKYVARCAKEYGSLFPKLAKIRETLLKEKMAFAGKMQGADQKVS